jgi:DNA-binding transcriptional regulator YhcF (GntR family)
MENKEKRHIELPSTEGINDLTPQDQLIYLGIRSFMNKDTMKAFPSQKSIADRVGCCEKTVRKCIQNLVDKEYIEIEKEGRKQIYKFNKLKQFEPFSYEFLEDRSITFTQRALLASSQQYMKEKETGKGIIKYSKMELAELINMPYPTLVKATRELANKDIINTTKLPSGKQQMEFALEKYHQGIVKVLLNHEQRIENTEQRVNDNEERISILENQVKFLQEELLKERENKNIKL